MPKMTKKAIRAAEEERQREMNRPSERRRRARHALRLYKQGIRMFRWKDPHGDTVEVSMVDVQKGECVLRRMKRKTIFCAPLHELWPEIR